VAIPARLERGRIVWANYPDSSGNPTHPHPAVILTSHEEIVSGSPIVVVGVSTNKDLAPEEEQVLLPWHPRGITRTKLKKPCYAVCSWLVSILETDIIDFAGFVPGAQLTAILTKIQQSGQYTTPPPPHHVVCLRNRQRERRCPPSIRQRLVAMLSRP
jgi:mRNA-degrading endonuclease toxin of MazEF toxin-antitoxin module